MQIFSRAYREKYPLEWKKLPRRIFVPLLLTLFVCVLPMYLLYTNNTDEMPFALIIPPLTISAACGLGLLAILTLILRKPASAGLWSAALMAVFLNFSTLKSLSGAVLPSIDTIAGGIVLSVILLTGCFFLIRAVEKKNIQSKIALIFMATLGFLLLSATIGIVPSIVRIMGEPNVSRSSSQDRGDITRRVTDDPQMVSVTEKKEGKTDIYLFIMDEYADFTVFGKYYDESEEAFRRFLLDIGFSISDSSYSNSLSTPKCMADLVNLDYVATEKMTDKEARTLNGETSALYEAFRSLGYALYQVSTSNGYFNSIMSLREPEILEKVRYMTENGSTVEDIAADKSILSIFNIMETPGDEDITEHEALPLLTTEEVFASEGYRTLHEDWKPWVSNVLGIFDFFQEPSNPDFAEKTVVFSYICCPHVPFLFKADGTILHEGRRTWSVKDYYAGQHQFVSRRLRLVVTSLIRRNPGCVIILQSDHGIRNHVAKLRIEERDAYRIFNAVYFGGRRLDIEGKSALNTLRLILTSLGAEGYPQIDEPVRGVIAGGNEDGDAGG
ncbi:MAG: hypothetical protein JW881_21050 [Spirochaetales bacterium]|nr:hypothetical protein [Spirochaetales bacterium]